MNNNELLSALIDGELQTNELDKALQLLATNEQAKTQFQRYQQTKDVLQGYAERGLNSSLVNKVSVELDSEPVYSKQRVLHKAEVITLPTPYWKKVSSLAIAASVGALAVVGVMTQPQNNVLTNTPVAIMDTPAPNKAVAIAQLGERWTVAEPEVESRLNSYLLDHNEQTGTSGVFSYARVVSYGAE